MRIKIYTLILLSSYCLFGRSQLTKGLNSLRADDEIVKQQVAYKKPGKAGANQFWDFSELTALNPEYKVTYLLPETIGDTLQVLGSDTLSVANKALISREHYTLYYHLFRNDSLLLLGHENQNTQLRYANPLPELTYPFNYQDVFLSDYQSEIIYSGTDKTQTRGTLRTEADAYGKMLLPKGDTLTVLRVKTTQLITHIGNTTDSTIASENLTRVVETYRWYSKGYRYPVFETIRSIHLSDSVEHFNTAFYFPPQEHDYLDSDPENVAVLDSLWNIKNQPDKFPAIDEKGGMADCKVYPNPVEDVLFVEYELMENSDVDMLLYNLAGEMVYRNRTPNRVKGAWQETISCTAIPSGNYLLKIISNKDIITEKISKK